MKQGCFSSNAPVRSVLAAHWWIAMFIVALVLTGAVEYRSASDLESGSALDQLFSYKVAGYAHLLLAGSTVLYVAHLWRRAGALGLWASCLAALGALGLFGALALRAAEGRALQGVAHIPLASLDEVMALFSGFTVLIYLGMERAYRSRAAGAFVMPVVLGAVLFQAWLGSQQRGAAGNLPLLLSYEVRAHMLATLMAYGAFTVAAAMGVLYLLRQHAELHGPALGYDMRVLHDLARTERLMHRAVLLGFPLFSAAIVLGVMAARNAWGRYWAWDPKETWSLVVWATYGGYLYWHYLHGWRGRRMAWWAIAGFALAVFGVLGVNLLLTRLHGYA